MTDQQNRDNWELIAKSLLLLLALGIVSAFAFWQGTKYCGQAPWPNPNPMPWPTPTPAPDYDTWYSVPASMRRCLPTQLCDGIPRQGWTWQINQRGIVRYAPPVWGDEGPTELPSELLKELESGGIGAEPESRMKEKPE